MKKSFKFGIIGYYENMCTFDAEVESTIDVNNYDAICFIDKKNIENLISFYKEEMQHGARNIKTLDLGYMHIYDTGYFEICKKK